MDMWIAIVEDSNGKIHIFEKFTDDVDAFAYEVRGWDAGTVLTIYRNEDVVQHTIL